MLKLSVALLLVLSPLGAKPPKKPAIPTFLETASGLKVADLKEGKGAEVKPGQTPQMLYQGWLYDTELGRRGKLFDQHQLRKAPFEFPLGAGRVIPGWDQGIGGMRVGGKRVLIIPAHLGYGAKGAKDEKGEFVIPPGATLLFEVELVGIKG